MGLHFIPTKTPRLYDLSLSNFRSPADRNYEGARIRVPVKVSDSSPNYYETIEKVRRENEKRFPGATILIIPRFEEAGAQETILRLSSTDEEKVRAYMKATLPTELFPERERIASYLTSALKKTSKAVTPRPTEVNFRTVTAKNCLSFEEVKLNLQFQGVKLILGRNDDWDGASNGSGKTGLCQLLRVGLYGETSKGQTHDRLIRKGSPKDATCRVVVQYRNGHGDSCTILRGRRPSRLRYLVNGRERSSGIQGKSTGVSTQEAIEQSVGMTVQAFDHGIVIDQKLLQMANSFLTGTDKDRKELLGEFLHTERFQAASDILKRVQAGREREAQELADKIGLAERTVEEIERELQKVKENVAYQQMVERLAEVIKKMNLLQYKEGRLEEVQDSKVSVEGIFNTVRGELFNLEIKAEKTRVERNHLQDQMSRMRAHIGRRCPTCGTQMTKELADLQTKQMVGRFDILTRLLKAQTQEVKGKLLEVSQAEERQDAVNAALEEERAKWLRWQGLRRQREAIEKELKESPLKEMEEQLQQRLDAAAGALTCIKHALEGLQRETPMMEYCVRAFSRQGIVSYLFAQVTGPLNKAAEEYAEMFTGGVIQLRFSNKTELRSGEETDRFSVQVVNTQGGEERADQSRGEEQLAAFMCILALREIGPKANVLILDEPTEGLDPVNSRRFADGLEKLTDRIPGILLATHNELVKQRFRGHGALVVVKRDGVSRIRDWQEGERV